MVLNTVMSMIEKDAEMIRQLGGSTKVAQLLGLTEKGGVQRVQNWITRGIPAQIKLDHADLFPQQRKAANANIAPAATETIAPA
jgi:hypothetical protein